MRRRREANMCFAFTQNLCFADCVVGFTLLSLALRPTMAQDGDYLPLEQRCSLRICLVGTACQTSICALGTIAADRFFTIMRPFRRDQFLSSKSAWMLNISIWIFSLGTNLLPVLGWRRKLDYDVMCPENACRISCLNFIPRGFARAGFNQFSDQACVSLTRVG